MDIKRIMSAVDHTLLSPTATQQQIKQICDDAVRFQTASVCIPPSYISFAEEYLDGRVPICTVIGFPNGYNTSAVKCAEAREALQQGAKEIDMVINLGHLKDGRYDVILDEIKSLKSVCEDKILKVIVETCLLTREEKIRMCEIVTESGADFIKTSTGFSSSGATFDDVELFSQHVGNGLRIKAAGGIKSFDDAQRFIELGASRLGTSRLVSILKAQDSNTAY